MFIGAEFSEANLIRKNLSGIPQMVSQIFRGMPITADGQDFAAQVFVQAQDVPGRLGIVKPIVPGGSIQLNACGNQLTYLSPSRSQL